MSELTILVRGFDSRFVPHIWQLESGAVIVDVKALKLLRAVGRVYVFRFITMLETNGFQVYLTAHSV